MTLCVYPLTASRLSLNTSVAMVYCAAFSHSPQTFLCGSMMAATAATAPYLAGMETGWTQSLERLKSYVAKVCTGEKP